MPVVTGIGHERDESLADLAADVRAATPTAAAALVVPDLEDLVDEHLDRLDRLQATIQRVLVDRRRRRASFEQLELDVELFSIEN